jgi:MFS family permease
MTAILADSVETGNRTKLYTYRWMLQMSTRAMGPLLAAVLFTYVFDDTWHLDNVRNVFLAGMIATSVPALLLFFYDDHQTLGWKSEPISRSPSYRESTGSVTAVNSGQNRSARNSASPEAEPLLSKSTSAINRDEGDPQQRQLSTIAEQLAAVTADPESLERTNSCCCGIKWVPWCLAFSDLMFCIGQGMTVKVIDDARPPSLQRAFCFSIMFAPLRRVQSAFNSGSLFSIRCWC